METFARLHTEPPLLLLEEVGRLPMNMSNTSPSTFYNTPRFAVFGRKEFAFAI